MSDRSGKICRAAAVMGLLWYGSIRGPFLRTVIATTGSPRGRYHQVTFEPLIAGVHPIATRMLLVVKVYGAKGMENIGEV